MFKEFVQNRIYGNASGYKCFLCKISLDVKYDTAIKHIEDQQHQLKFNKIDENDKEKKTQILLRGNEEIFKKMVNNNVVFNWGTAVFCHTCNCTFDYSERNLKKHVDSNLHLTLSKQEMPFKISQSGLKFGCYNYNKTTKTYTCNICNCQISGYTNLKSHVEGFSHMQKIEEINNQAVLKFNSNINSSNEQVLPTQESSRPNRIYNKFKAEICFCKLCNVYLYTTSELQCHVMIHLYLELNLNDVIQVEKTRKNIKVSCLFCNKTIKDYALFDHIITEKHLNYLKLFVTKKKNSSQKILSKEINSSELKKLLYVPLAQISTATYCKLCDVSLSNINAEFHFNGKRHKNNLENNDKRFDTTNKVDRTHFFKCFICNRVFATYQLLLKHHNSILHINKIEVLKLVCKGSYLQFKESKNKISVTCLSCKIDIDNYDIIIEHLKTIHKEILIENNKVDDAENTSVFLNVKSKNTATTNNKTKTNNKKSKSKKGQTIKYKVDIENLIALGFDPDQFNQPAIAVTKSDYSDANSILNNTPQQDVKCKEKHSDETSKRKFRLPSLSQYAKNVNYETNLKKYGKSFIKYCIEPGIENIYAKDNVDIQMLKLGTALILFKKLDTICFPCGISIPSDKQLIFDHLQCTGHIKKLREMVVNSSSFQEYPDQFSNLKLAQNYMHELSDDEITCNICNIEIENNDSTIHEHIKHPNHIAHYQLSIQQAEDLYKEFLTIYDNLWYYAQIFNCTICNVKYDNEIDFIKHLENSQHIKICTQLLSKKIILKFNVCLVCRTCWYTEVNYINSHYEYSFHKQYAEEDGYFKVPKMKIDTIDLLNNVDNELDILINESDSIIAETQKIQDLITDIENTVKAVYPNSTVYIFGSRLSNSAFPVSNVDVYLNCEDEYSHSISPQQSEQYLLSLKTQFETKSDIWVVNKLILNNKMPIVKLKHFTGLNCDISVNSILSTEKSRIVKLCNAVFPTCRKLILFLRKWLTSCALNESNFISTFVISWFVIFYLQVSDILPSVHDMVKQKNSSNTNAGWESNCTLEITATESNLTFQEHLQRFFSFYANFDYKTDVACPYLGKIIKKRNFAYLDELPKELNIVPMKEAEPKLVYSPMCFQDPIEHLQNITETVTKQKLRCFQQYCSGSASLLLI